MSSISALRPLLRDLLRVDRTQISFVTALRNTIGVVLPLAGGAATGHLLAGLTMAVGALNVAFSDRPGPYHHRASRMLLASLCGALSVFVGSATGTINWLAVVLAVIWGFAGGLMVALGPAAAQIGITSIILLVVFGGQPQALHAAADSAALVLAGGVLQTALAVAAWPLRPYGPQRDAMASVFRGLSAATRAPASQGQAPPVTGALSEARAVLAAMGSDYSTEAEALRSLLDEAERIRLELLALDDLRERLRGVADAAALVGRITSVLAATGDVLAALADGIATRQPPAGITAALQRIEQEARALRHPDREDVGGAQRLWVAEGLAHVEALAGELRAAVEIATQESPGGEEAAARVEARRPLWLRFHQPIAVLRANLSLRSTACRHALRLAVCLGIASALARSLDVSHTYWIPLTAAIILKPDFGATLKFSIGRAVGTLLGLGVSTVLIVTVLGHVWGRILLIGVFVFFVRSIGRANYGLLVLGVTAFVVLFTSFAGARPESTILERGIDTLVGGALALLIYVLWPTWERSRVSAVLADLLEAYRRYFRAVMAGYLDPRQANPAEMSEARQAARLARTNAEASVDRLRGEPARSTEQLDRAVSLLASSHRFARSAMAFEAARHEGVHLSAPDTLYSFAGDVDTTLHELSRSLRDPSYRARKLPDLRADQQALAEALSETLPQEGTIHLAGYGTAIIAGEADRMTDSVNTMAQALMRADR